MSYSPVPQYSFREIVDVSTDFIKSLGVRFLMLDLDNTVATYSERTPPDSISLWVESMKDCGVELCIVSNSTRKCRVYAIAENLGVEFIMGASKPSPKGILQAMDAAGFSAVNSAFIGDQIFTDALAANRAGVVSIVVRPRSLANPILALRYATEAPFRAIGRKKMKKAYG